MVFKKIKQRKEAEKQARARDFRAEEQRFEAAIGAAGQLADPAEKILQLEEIGQEIAQYIDATDKSVYEKAAEKANIGFYPALAVGGAITVVAVPVGIILPPVGAWIALAGASTMIGGTFVVAPFRFNRTISKLLPETESHLQKMQDLLKNAGDMKDETVKNEVTAVVKSPFYKKVLELPGLAEAFKGQPAPANEETAQQNTVRKPPPAAP